jgi:MFS family permease
MPPDSLLTCHSIQCASVNVAMLVVGRVIAGLCVGIASSICPVYQAEIAPKEIRGRVVSLQQWAITWGILIQYFIQYGASNIDGGPNNPNQGTAAFRIPWGVQIVPAVILFFGMFFLPRSPRWLASKDRWEEAIQVMAHLHGGGDINQSKRPCVLSVKKQSAATDNWSSLECLSVSLWGCQFRCGLSSVA